jgi:hypothetical protein
MDDLGDAARFRAAKISQLRETSGSRSDRSRRDPESVTDSPEAWRAIIAALRDDDVRAVLGETSIRTAARGVRALYSDCRRWVSSPWTATGSLRRAAAALLAAPPRRGS